MSVNNVKKNVLMDAEKLTDMVIPLVGLLQFGIGGFFAYVSKFFHTEFNLWMGFIFSVRHTIVCLTFLCVGLSMWQIKLFNKKSAPFIFISSISAVYLAGQLYTVSQVHSSTWHVAIWQVSSTKHSPWCRSQSLYSRFFSEWKRAQLWRTSVFSFASCAWWEV